MKVIEPVGWAKPKGYANGVLSSGSILFVAGQIGWDGNQAFHSDDFIEQTKQALQNVISIVKAAGGKPEQIAKMTWFVKSKKEYLERTKELGRTYAELFGRHFPAMTLVEVRDLLEDRAKIEIEAIAVI